MKAIKICATIALLAAGVGCTSTTRIEWGGKKAVRQPDGTVLVNTNGVPYYESEKNLYKDSNWLTRREERDVSVKANADGSYEAGLGARANGVSTNEIAIVTGGLDATTRLVSTCAAAYAQIAGGGAQTDTVLSTAKKIYEYFTAKGGDTSKATVTTSDGKVNVTDGSVSISCSEDGTCSPL